MWPVSLLGCRRLRLLPSQYPAAVDTVKHSRRWQVTGPCPSQLSARSMIRMSTVAPTPAVGTDDSTGGGLDRIPTQAAKPHATETSSDPPGFAERLVTLRRHLHRHPELSWHEEATARVVEDRLRALGLHPRRVMATGVVRNKCCAVRARARRGQGRAGVCAFVLCFSECVYSLVCTLICYVVDLVARAAAVRSESPFSPVAMLFP